MHNKDSELLDQIQIFFGVGTIHKRNNKSSAMYRVLGKDLIAVIIPFFDKFPLLTQKRGDFLLFKSIAELVDKKEHITIEGLKNIVRLKASLNRGLNEKLLSPKLYQWKGQ